MSPHASLPTPSCLSISPYLPPLTVSTLRSKQINSSQTSINVSTNEKYKWVCWNRIERDQKSKKENIFTTDQTIGNWCCWVEIKRQKEWERLSFTVKSACLPCMVLPRPWPNFQPCFWRSRCPMLSWCEEERKERPQYSNNKKRFPHTRTHSHWVTSTHDRQTTVKTSSLTVINISNICYTFKLLVWWGAEGREGDR